MGCVASKPDINDHHHNIFQVVNVDDLGHRFTAAKLEVTEAELILHQRGKTPTRWPLRCLRRFTAAKLEVTEAELILHQRGKTPTRWPLRCLRRSV
ncbi:hypothetical protein Pmani_025593 [Petrolisthes manimaculis]|uniref:Uncharacterized protein n=1 Tax=Petrolisthes manimaculis TaxID=1843537 RepID=A0AAE1P7H8_9EUCA|nr:hypothetical protein Pmani_025593 [Petrolisthes manimaculis]